MAIERLTDDVIGLIADELNERVNIPFIGEGTEKELLVKVVKRIDDLLAEELPPELYNMLRDAGDGVTEEEAAELKEKLVTKLNGSLDIPFISEDTEEGIIRDVLDVIVAALVKNASL